MVRAEGRPRLIAILLAAVLGVALAVTVAETKTGSAAVFVAAAPFAVLLMLARPDLGTYAIIFMAPFVDVFKTTTMGITLRLNEVCGVVLCFLVILNMLRSKERWRPGRLDLFILGLMGSMLVSIIANIGNLPSEEALRQVPTAWIGVEGILDTPAMATWKRMVQAVVAFAAYFVVSNQLATREAWRRAAAVLVVSSMLVCAWSLLNLLGFLAGMKSGLGITPGNIWFTGGAPRITGTLSEPSYFANYLLVVIPMVFFCYARGTVLVGRRWDLAALVLLCATLFFTFSGGGWTVFAFEALLMLAICARHRVPMGKLARMLLALAICGSLGLLAAALFTDMDYGKLAADNWRKLAEVFSSGVGSGRRVVPDVGWMMFADHPLFGVGPGRFRVFEYAYLVRLGYTDDLPSSSFYASMLGELGVLGMVMVAGIFASLTALCFRRARLAGEALTRSLLWGMGVAVAAMSVHYLAHATLWWPYVWIVFGLAAAGGRLAREDAAMEELQT